MTEDKDHDVAATHVERAQRLRALERPDVQLPERDPTGRAGVVDEGERPVLRMTRRPLEDRREQARVAGEWKRDRCRHEGSSAR